MIDEHHERGDLPRLHRRGVAVAVPGAAGPKPQVGGLFPSHRRGRGMNAAGGHAPDGRCQEGHTDCGPSDQYGKLNRMRLSLRYRG